MNRDEWTAEQALDNALVASCLGTLKSFKSPDNALNQLLCYEQDLGAYFAREEASEEAKRLRDVLEVIRDGYKKWHDDSLILDIVLTALNNKDSDG